jgi:hypothetical protein
VPHRVADSADNDVDPSLVDRVRPPDPFRNLPSAKGPADSAHQKLQKPGVNRFKRQELSAQGDCKAIPVKLKVAYLQNTTPLAPLRFGEVLVESRNQFRAETGSIRNSSAG